MESIGKGSYIVTGINTFIDNWLINITATCTCMSSYVSCCNICHKRSSKTSEILDPNSQRTISRVALTFPSLISVWNTNLFLYWNLIFSDYLAVSALSCHLSLYLVLVWLSVFSLREELAFTLFVPLFSSSDYKLFVTVRSETPRPPITWVSYHIVIFLLFQQGCSTSSWVLSHCANQFWAPGRWDLWILWSGLVRHLAALRCMRNRAGSNSMTYYSEWASSNLILFVCFVWQWACHTSSTGSWSRTMPAYTRQLPHRVFIV
jgi:hypothetical protein